MRRAAPPPVRWAAVGSERIWRSVYRRVLRRASRDRLTATASPRPQPRFDATTAADEWGHRALVASLATYEVDTGVPDEAARLGAVGEWMARHLALPDVPRPVRSVTGGPAPTLVLSSECGEVLQVASRGTFSVLDVWEDFRSRVDETRPSDGLGPCRVHAGFLDAYRRQATDVLPALPHGGLVMFQGHSLGAVVAQMLAVAYARRRREATGDASYRAPLMTFGLPRGGDAAYQREVAELTSHVRVYHGDDPIATLPCAEMPLARRRFWGGEYAPHAADMHVRLCNQRGAAAASREAGSEPATPHTLVTALARFSRYHTQNAYADAMLAHLARVRQ